MAHEPVTDAHLAERFAAEVLRDRYVWGEPPRPGWRAIRPEWKPVSDEQVIELARTWLLGEFRAFLAAPAGGTDVMNEWKRQLSARHVRGVASLAKGIMLADEDELPHLYPGSDHAEPIPIPAAT